MATQLPPPGAMAARLDHMRSGADPENLSPRERECLLMTAMGVSDADVASCIEISESTVRFHLRNAARKLSAGSRRQAIYLAAKLDLI